MGFLTSTPSVKIRLLHKEAKVPSRAYEDAACWDVYSCVDVTIQPWHGKTIDIGLAMELPKGWMAQIYTRSRHGFKGLRVHLGIIDADYRGPISPYMLNQTPNVVSFRKGERIAQMYFTPVPRIKMKKVKRLSPSVRGERGFGSSGK
jgi:dUTP pyrophosphatase